MSFKVKNKKSNISRYSFLVLGLFVIFILSCKKKDDITPVMESGTLTDIDHNVYKTIKIGNQWWMAEDLKVRRYRNGDYINQIPLDSDHFDQWSLDTIGAYCSITDNGQVIIGKYYNWYAVNNTAGLAPQGWHIATDDEWKELEMYLGMSQSDADKLAWRGTDQGNKLKIASSLQGWTTYGDIWSTNENGFSAIANGCRLFSGGSGKPGLFSTEFWWTSNGQFGNEAYYRYLDYKNPNVFRSHCLKNYGFSVRCVKD